jgi:hypothetical protein
MTHRIIIENGNFINSDLITSFCRVILHHSGIQRIAVKTLTGSLLTYTDNQSLIQCAAWVIGEFLTDNDSSYSVLKKLMSLPQTSDTTKGCLLTAISKLAARFGLRDDLLEFSKSLLTANSLDLQQRAGELVVLLNRPDLCEAVLLPMERVDESEVRAKLVDQTPSLLDLGEDSKPVDRIEDDLLLIDTMDIQPRSQHQEIQSPSSHQSDIRALIDVDAASPVLESKDNRLAITPFPGSVEGLRKQDYVLFFEVRKNPGNLKQIAVRVSAFNLGKTSFSNFGMKFAVSGGWRLQAQPPSAVILEPIGGRPVTQQLMIMGQGEFLLQMRVQISYQYGSQPITEIGDVNPAVFA